MPYDWSREDLTGKWLGEIGRQLLVIATELRKGKRPLSSFLIVDSVVGDINKIKSRLSTLEDPNGLELVTIEYLGALQGKIDVFKDVKTTPPQIAEELEHFGKRLYEERFDSEEPPKDLNSITEKLHTLIDSIKVYGPDNPIVEPMAKWIAAGISLLFHPSYCSLPSGVLSCIRDRAFAAMSFLNDVGSYEQEECIIYLSETADFLRKHGKPKSKNAKWNDAKTWKDIQKRLERLREQGESYTSQRELAARLGCSESTINKAIQASDKLKSWMGTQMVGKMPRATSLNEAVLHDAEQTTEHDPSETIPDDDVDIILTKLMEEAKPEERAKLNELGPEERRSLAKTYLQQCSDNEPSPLTGDSAGLRAHLVKQHKQV
jgi:DNA-directed RNA polymerase specialized sigma24 family protein